MASNTDENIQTIENNPKVVEEPAVTEANLSLVVERRGGRNRRMPVHLRPDGETPATALYRPTQTKRKN